jgi:hypothetical protein
MRKAASAAILGLSAAVAVGSQQQGKTDWEMDGLAGRVRSYLVEEISLVQKFGDWREDSRHLSESRSYDAHGRCIEAYADSDGGSLAKTDYAYDGRGNRIESVRYNPDGSLDVKLVYTYDAAGNNSEEAAYGTDGLLIYKTVSTFDTDAHRVESTRYNAQGSLVWKSVFTYDTGENEIDVARYNSDGALMWKSVSRYDGTGKEVESARYFADGSLMGRSVYAYDQAGNRVESSEYDADGSVRDVAGWRYEFDETGNWVKKTEQRKVSKFGKTSWEPTGAVWRRTIQYYN